MTLEEINDEISRLQIIQRQMREEEENKHRAMALQYVGRCYRSFYGQFIKIIGVPRTRLTMTSKIYNAYQFPAVVLQYTHKPNETYIIDGDEACPFYYDDVYFNLWDDDSSQPKSHYEITKEEFDAEFNKCVEHFKRQIDEMVNYYDG